MWFPEIFERFNQYDKLYPNQHASVCVVSESFSNADMFDDSGTCDNSINGRVFVDTFIIGLSCIPTSVSLSYFMRKLGKKTVLSKCSSSNTVHHHVRVLIFISLFIIQYST